MTVILNSITGQRLSPLKGNERHVRSRFARRLSGSPIADYLGVDVRERTIVFLKKKDFLDDLINYKFPHRKVCGVYTIQDYYVGSSKHVKSRIKSHLRNVVNDRHCNKKFTARVIEDLTSGLGLAISVTPGGLSEEYALIEKLIGMGYPLTNSKIKQ